MPQIGPQLDRLLHRLADCPSDFWRPPDEIDIVALACDHFRALGATLPDPAGRRSVHAGPAEARSLIAIVLWLLCDDWFIERPELADATWRLLRDSRLWRLAQLVRTEAFVNDPDRREELVRLCLKSLDLTPAGETAAQAADRLTTLDTIERERVIRQTRDAEARARAIREAMALRRAKEAAARYSPE